MPFASRGWPAGRARRRIDRIGTQHRVKAVRLVKWLLGLAVAATAVWCGAWFVGARSLEQALDEALARPGMPLHAASHAVRGFPNRLDVTLTAPSVTLADFTWTAPFVQVFALIYRPHHVIAVFPPVQQGRAGGADWRLAAGDARASVIAAPTRNLEIERAVAVLDGVDLTLAEARLRLDALRLAARRTNPGVYEAVAEAVAVFPDAGWLAGADPGGIWPRRFDVLRLDLEADFVRPLDLEALRSAPSPPPRLILTGARAAWDGAGLRLSGRVELDAPGGPTGDVVLAVEGWADVVDRLARAGLISPEQRRWIERIAPSLARNGESTALDIPLRLVAGQVRLGRMVLFDLGTSPAPDG